MCLLLTGPVLKALHRTAPVSRRHRERVGERKDCLASEEKDITFEAWAGWVWLLVEEVNGDDQKYPKNTCLKWMLEKISWLILILLILIFLNILNWRTGMAIEKGPKYL